MSSKSDLSKYRTCSKYFALYFRSHNELNNPFGKYIDRVLLNNSYLLKNIASSKVLIIYYIWKNFKTMII